MVKTLKKYIYIIYIFIYISNPPELKQSNTIIENLDPSKDFQ